MIKIIEWLHEERFYTHEQWYFQIIFKYLRNVYIILYNSVSLKGCKTVVYDYNYALKKIRRKKLKKFWKNNKYSFLLVMELAVLVFFFYIFLFGQDSQWQLTEIQF